MGQSGSDSQKVDCPKLQGDGKLRTLSHAMTDAGAKSYDDVPYQGVAAARSHPGNLATLGTLLGMTPADITHCRVLELGCAEGGNLIPMGCALPESEFVGVDYAERQIVVGQGIVKELGLANVKLQHRNIIDVDDSFGRFDYIIVHGVLSWIPADVRTKVFEVCKRNLNPQGIAFVSYSTHPGGHLRRMVRDMMLYHAERHPDKRERVGKSRELLDFLIEAAPDEQTAYKEVLQWEHRHIQPFPDHQVRHDILSDVHEAFYFTDVVDQARAHNLQYLGDANFSTMLPGNFSPKVFETLKRFGRNLVEVEQYMDFIRNRTLRKTLLCHADVTLKHGISPAKVFGLHVASSIVPSSAAPDIVTRKAEQFVTNSGAEVRATRPITKAAFVELSKIWPESIVFETLLERARARVRSALTTDTDQPSANEDGALLAEALMECYGNELIELNIRATDCTSIIAEKPVGSHLSRFQAIGGNLVTNQRHEVISLNSVQRLLLQHLDGTRDRDRLLDLLVDFAAKGKLVVERHGKPVTERSKMRTSLSRRLDSGLAGLAKSALLVK